MATKTLKNAGRVLLELTASKKEAQEYAADARSVGYTAVKVTKNRKGSYEVTANAVSVKSNPGGNEYVAAVEASEQFHGTPSSEAFDVETEVFEHETLADLGELISLDIAAVNGGTVHLHGFAKARLAQAPKGYPFQLFIVGGDQSVDLAEFNIEEPHEKEVLGKLKRIKYYTVKHHLGKDGGEANYKHKLGEIDGRLPTVIYDVLNESLEIAGGGYVILPEGIDN